jgi:hypothetical protein
VDDEGLDGREEVPPVRGEPVADRDRCGRFDDPVDQAYPLKLLQPCGQHAVRQSVDAGDDLGEPAGAARQSEKNAAVPAAAEQFDDGCGDDPSGPFRGNFFIDPAAAHSA